MNYFDTYKKRIQATGSTEGEAYSEATKDFVRKSFSSTPTYKVIELNEETTEVRFSKTSSNEAALLFLPEQLINKGDLAKIDSEDWLLLETIPDDMYPKAKISICNQLLKWSDKLESFSIPCIVSTGTFDLEEDEKFIVTTEKQLKIIAQYNSQTKNIFEKQKFIFNSRVYEVIGVDDITEVINDKGILKFTVELTSMGEQEVDKDVADNTNNNGWGEW